MNLTREDVQDILRLLDATSFVELHLETDRFKLTLRRGEDGGWTQEQRTTAKPNVVAVEESTAIAPVKESTAPATRESESQDNNAVDICTPIIGTFYRAPKPGAPPFVEIGSRVTPETVIGIVETMKLMNSVCAGVTGTITEICADNGAFVEQNCVLMRAAIAQ